MNRSKRGTELKALLYTKTLGELSKAKGTLGQTFVKSQHKIQDSAKRYKIIDMVDNKSGT